MPIEPGFKVRLGTYRITPEVEALRREIWDLLAPHIEAVLHACYDNALIHATYYKDLIEKSRLELVARDVAATKKLLLEPFDEAWVESAYTRAEAEAASGMDMRTRGSIAIFILTELNRLIAARHRFSVQRAMSLVDAATRVVRA